VDTFSFVLATAIASATPVLLAAQGELLAERSGILNLGVEGMMLLGALTGFAVTNATGNALLGIAGAATAGAALAFVHAFFTITLRANQIVTGLSLAIFGGGLSSLFGQSYVGRPPRATIGDAALGPLADIPFIGPILFDQSPFFYAALVITASIAFFLSKTRPGLVLRALGERPEAVDVFGMPVAQLRYIYVVIGGALSGVGGAALSLSYTPSWVENMTAGRGWIAIALVIFALWRPWWVLAGAILFGAADSLGFVLQAEGTTINSYALAMLPYILTLAVLAIVGRAALRRRLGVPSALGVAYDRERR
jgi:general nucleoside transport system permease protein